MRSREAELAARAARIVFVSTGTPAMAAAFAAERAGPHPVLVDPARRTFAAAGMRRSLLGLLHPRALVNMLRAFWRGHRQGRIQGDAWQLGGVVVLASDGRVLRAQRDAAGGDLLDLEAVLRALPSGR